MYDPTTVATTTTGTSGCSYPPYTNCIHRLPCGLCVLLHSLCPLGNIGTVGISWGEVTCNTEAKDG